MSRRKEPAIPDELLDQLLAVGDAGTALAQGGLLDALKKALTERALNAEMDHHLAGDDGVGNSRNGYGRKTVVTDTGKLALNVPRDRQASFDPQLIAKYQRRFPGIDFGLPLLIYDRKAPRSDDVAALMASPLQFLLWSFLRFVRHLRVDALSILVLAGIALWLAMLEGASGYCNCATTSSQH